MKIEINIDPQDISDASVCAKLRESIEFLEAMPEPLKELDHPHIIAACKTLLGWYGIRET